MQFCPAGRASSATRSDAGETIDIQDSARWIGRCGRGGFIVMVLVSGHDTLGKFFRIDVVTLS
jgi:hypothetical protein